MANRETERQFQERTFPAKIKRVKTKTGDVLGPFSTASQQEKGKAERALRAVGRIEKRFKKAKSKPAPTKGFFGSVVDAFTGLARLPAREKEALGGVREKTARAAKKAKGVG